MVCVHVAMATIVTITVVVCTKGGGGHEGVS